MTRDPGATPLRRRTGRRPEPRIVDLATHPRTHVSIRVAADFLDLDERTVRARIDAGHLRASQDGRRVRIPLESLAEYAKARHVPRSTT